MIEFRQKNFNILSDITRGAAIGGNIGLASTLFRPKADPTTYNDYNDKDKSKRNEKWKVARNMTAMGTIVGAALGALVGGIKEIATMVNRKNTVDRRLMEKVVEVLKRDNFKDGVDFTRDPKTANTLKTKVCVVISKVSGELRLSVNLISDSKLKTVSDEIIKRLPNTSVATEKMSDRFNDIIITSISDSSADTGLIVGVIEKFIHSGYPVYLVEVG